MKNWLRRVIRDPKSLKLEQHGSAIAAMQHRTGEANIALKTKNFVNANRTKTANTALQQTVGRSVKTKKTGKRSPRKRGALVGKNGPQTRTRKRNLLHNPLRPTGGNASMGA
ncbi:MAG: hypothetical protein KGL98_04795 [Gammaproteobacteria bacterium]|nr:hypothetical protein [Gammaproteobacteria bacterium]MBU6510412.1 hypothetical protein [Gammaproteobacteria bacterium]MDE2460545.1 hypothetical protein [Gammaproteobacteria bacterium]